MRQVQERSGIILVVMTVCTALTAPCVYWTIYRLDLGFDGCPLALSIINTCVTVGSSWYFWFLGEEYTVKRTNLTKALLGSGSTFSVALLGLAGCIAWDPSLRGVGVWTGFDLRRAALDFNGLRRAMSLALPGTLSICAEWWSFEILALFGKIGTPTFDRLSIEPDPTLHLAIVVPLTDHEQYHCFLLSTSSGAAR